MSSPVRIAINGAAGRMGGQLLELLRDDVRFKLAAARVPPDAACLGAPVHAGAAGYAAAWPDQRPDVVVDFSTPAGLAGALEYCETEGVALVSGTTGVDPALHERLAIASRRIALMHESNFSLGVAVLTQLLRRAAAALASWDLEIVETHHGRKQDAPSGTALALGEAAAAARGTTLARVAAPAERKGARSAGQIGFAVVRGGDVVGEHTALLIGEGERIELAHRASDRSVFARGALEAAQWLAGRTPGAYSLHDLLTARDG